MRKEKFFEENNNNISKIKHTIKYLLYDTKDEYQTRMANCIYNDKIILFGESCIKELFGVINNQDIPPCNDRVLKSMQYLGFGDLK